MTERTIHQLADDLAVPRAALEMAELQEQIHRFETFVKRRFDELSMEINATSQQMDMAEDNLGQRFGEIFEVLQAISFKGAGKTAANAGVELDAVVDMTENAANTILDAAGHITSIVGRPDNWNTEEARQKALEAINDHTEEIFMACSFQDITGQRIRKTLENIKTIEDRLGQALDKLGIQVEHSTADRIQTENYASSQDDIDALFANAGNK
ncbi:MAG: protein phosphatase CheZ [Alphaproteobacteria bacterium]|nr:protein phosphatase CheZ [Alphaproteobacteria bacterium]